MSTRKYLRNRVRARAVKHGMKSSKAVHNWRRILNAYPGFKGMKRQKSGSQQEILKYPVILYESVSNRKRNGNGR